MFYQRQIAFSVTHMPTSAEFAQEVEKIISTKRLSQSLIKLIREALRQRIDLPEFNPRYFLEDLLGFVKFSKMEDQLRLNNNSRNIMAGLEISDAKVKEILKAGRITQYKNYGVVGTVKKSFITAKNEIVRVYYQQPSLLFYNRMSRGSEADIITTINNDLLTVHAIDFHGLPMDIMERALPLNEALESAKVKQDVKLLKMLQQSRASNPLMSKNLIEDKPENCGLVIRLDQRRNKRVYVVVFDLQNDHREYSPEMYVGLSQAKPLSIAYERVLKSIPQINELATPFRYIEHP